jgi:hypothetical protein
MLKFCQFVEASSKGLNIKYLLGWMRFRGDIRFTKFEKVVFSSYPGRWLRITVFLVVTSPYTAVYDEIRYENGPYIAVILVTVNRYRIQHRILYRIRSYAYCILITNGRKPPTWIPVKIRCVNGPYMTVYGRICAVFFDQGILRVVVKVILVQSPILTKRLEKILCVEICSPCSTLWDDIFFFWRKYRFIAIEGSKVCFYVKFSIFWKKVKNSDVGKVLISNLLQVSFQWNFISRGGHLLGISSPNYRIATRHLQEIFKN